MPYSGPLAGRREEEAGNGDGMEEIVSRNPRVLNGDLVFAATRVPVKNLVDYLAAGDTLEEFLDDFPGVSREQAEGYLRTTMDFAGEKLAAGHASGHAPG